MGATEIRALNFQLIKKLKASFLRWIAEMKKQHDERELQFIVHLENRPVKGRITLIADHWRMFGSVTIRLENLPITYDGSNLEVDFYILLMEPVTSASTISGEWVYFIGASISLSDPQAFEQWIKDQVTNAWNDQ